MAFVVDSSEWKFEGKPPEIIIQSIDNFLERLLVAHERKEKIWIGEDLQTQPVFEDYDLWSFLNSSEYINFPPELTQELAAYLGRAARYEDEDYWPTGFAEQDVHIDGELESKNLDLAWAHFNSREGDPVACLGLFREGDFKTKSIMGIVPIFWVKSEYFHRQFWRQSINYLGGDENTLKKFSVNAFPDLYFHERSWEGIGNLTGGYYAFRVIIQKYLSILDDHGAWAFTAPPPILSPFEPQITDSERSPSKEIIQRRFTGLGLT